MDARVTAAIARGKRPDPSRTRKLRPTAPMVLHPGGCGRVGHRRNTIHGRGPPTTLGVLPHLTPRPPAPPHYPPPPRNPASSHRSAAFLWSTSDEMSSGQRVGDPS